MDFRTIFWLSFLAVTGAVPSSICIILEDTIARDNVQRMPCWTESLAVGSMFFFTRIQPLILSRRETEIVEDSANGWVLHEVAAAHGS